MREAVIQRQIIEYIERLGFYVVKIIQCNKNGFPDLMVLIRGTVIFIEVKSATGKVSELQKYRHKQLIDNGHPVIITSSLTHFKNELTAIGEELQKQRTLTNSN
jgi:Holliday junction resolvase